MDIKSSAAAAVEQPNQSLFDRLGGAAAVDAAVDLFYRKVLADPTVNSFFDTTDMEGQRAKQKAFLTMAFGGPNNYSGKDLRAAHAPLVAKGLSTCFQSKPTASSDSASTSSKRTPPSNAASCRTPIICPIRARLRSAARFSIFS